MNFLRRLIALGLVWGGLTQLPGTATAAGYTLTDLGPGSAVAINSSGIIALNDGDKAFRVTDGNRQELRLITDVFWASGTQAVYYASRMRAADINDAGHIAGSAERAGGIEWGGFVDFGNTNVLLFPAEGRQRGLNAINNDGLVAGTFSYAPSEESFMIPVMSLTAQYEWEQLLMPTLFAPLPGGPAQTGYLAGGGFSDIREDRVTVGTVATADLSPRPIGGWLPRYHRGRAARMDTNGVITFLDPRPANDQPGWGRPSLSEAFAINASDEIVGQMAVVADGPVHAFRHAGAGLGDLGTLGGTTSGALDINAGGVIVGYSTIANGDSRAFIWQSGTMIDLNTLVPAGTGLVLTKANAINDAGQIVGEARAGARTNAFVLSPMTVGVAPRLTLQPQGTNIALGGTVILSVAATGSLPLSVQWQKGLTNLAGATDLTLQLTNVTAFDSGEYRAVMTNAFGQAISQTVTVTVLDPQLATHTLVGLTIRGSIGASYRVEFTPTLGPVNWQTLTTVTLTNSPQWWVDFDSPGISQRTYRAIRLPPE